MKITLLTTSTQSVGGVERFTSYLQASAKSYGHDVIVVSRENIGVSGRVLLAILKIFGLEQPLLGYLLGSIAKREAYDICVGNGLLGWNLHGNMINVQHGTFARAADRIDKKNPIKFFIKKYVWGFFEGLAARRAVQCIAVSEETKESVEKFYHAKNVVIIPNVVDTNLFKPGDKKASREKLDIQKEQLVALFVGRFEYAKGKDILEGIRKYLAEKNGRLIVAENYSQEELADLYTAADIFLLPSLHEGCSYALLEAMSCGLPFLASSVGLVADFATEGIFTDCIVLGQTFEAYLPKMQKLLSLSEERKKALTDQLRAYILERHASAIGNRAYEALFQKIQ